MWMGAFHYEKMSRNKVPGRRLCPLPGTLFRLNPIQMSLVRNPPDSRNRISIGIYVAAFHEHDAAGSGSPADADRPMGPGVHHAGLAIRPAPHRRLGGDRADSLEIGCFPAFAATLPGLAFRP